jgi:hypothetical protein
MGGGLESERPSLVRFVKGICGWKLLMAPSNRVSVVDAVPIAEHAIGCGQAIGGREPP